METRMKIKANSKNILKEVFVIILTGLVVPTMYSIVFLVLFLISISSGIKSEFIPLIRYITNTALVTFIAWAAYGIYLLIASRFWIAGIVIGTFSIISTFITVIPKYLILSKLGYVNIFVASLEQMVMGFAIVIVSILVLTTKNRNLSFFVGYGILIIYNMIGNYNDNPIVKIMICFIPIILFFIEKAIYTAFVLNKESVLITPDDRQEIFLDCK